MGSSVFQSWQVLVWVIILMVTPIFGTFITILLNMVNGREIPPILPQLNIQSFGQAFVAMIVLGLIYKTTKTVFVIFDAIVIVFLFFVLLVQAVIDRKQLVETQKHVKKVLKEKLDSKLKGEMDLIAILDLADCMIDVDYFPESRTNQLSGYPRRERRNQFIKIISANLEENLRTNIVFNEKDFLIPDNEAKLLKNVYVFVSVVSVLFYITSILLSVFGQL